jgi:hypothetical protein
MGVRRREWLRLCGRCFGYRGVYPSMCAAIPHWDGWKSLRHQTQQAGLGGAPYAVSELHPDGYCSPWENDMPLTTEEKPICSICKLAYEGWQQRPADQRRTLLRYLQHHPCHSSSDGGPIQSDNAALKDYLLTLGLPD